MSRKPTQDEINAALWAACDSFRGTLDSSDYKNYILNFMFIKYLSDVWKDKYEEYQKQIGNNDELIRRKMNRERFVLPDHCTFDYIVENKHDADLGSLINKITEKIEDENKMKMEGVFKDIDFNSDRLGNTKDRNRRLKNLIDDFDKPQLNFRPSVIGSEDIIGNAYMYLIERFASGAGKKGGEFYTPHPVSELLAKLMMPKAGDRICDPTCGSGSLLITVAEQVPFREGTHLRDCSLFGQESNGGTWALAKMNMFLHGMDAAHIEWGDTLNQPLLIEGDHLMKFEIVVANPPFSLDKWGAERAASDTYKRFMRGVPPKTKGDYAFVLHMIDTAVEGTGKVGVIVPHGVLFRGSSERQIRESLVRDNLLEAVIGLPSNLFFGTGIPAAILLFNKGKKTEDVLFIDASKDFESGKKQNTIREQHISRIVDTYKEYLKGGGEKEKYAHRATLEEIEKNEFNLNIPRYVDTFEKEEEIDIPAVQKRIEELDEELVKVKAEMNKYLKELGFK
ncbi:MULTISPECIES: type I restriction-modification system subunit M [Niastella]|uniref:site-specific DNA-methyltransferase (adenine-specific) n=1 Tax=Niastella soli TaxID=2821487 RepID=A0ABS3YRY4_9BACT|nr:type I restriction-modification system subunit M [Niastella soli]MBO9200604.1 type I restriction-modification system subunit M [Niastella soli]